MQHQYLFLKSFVIIMTGTVFNLFRCPCILIMQTYYIKVLEEFSRIVCRPYSYNSKDKYGHYVFRLILKKKESLFFRIMTWTYRSTFFLCYYLPKFSSNVYSLKYYEVMTSSFSILVKTRK